MKPKVLMAMVITGLLFVSTQVMGAWTLTPSKVAEAGHYYKWKVVCTSDGSALSATDILGEMSDRVLRRVQGETLMAMKISPGTGGVIPNTTINVTLSDDEQDSLFAVTGASKDAISWHDLSSDILIFIPVTGKLYLAVNDIGDNGDQITLYFITWRENI